MSEQRKEQFKEGIKDKTRDREFRAAITRRDKRDNTLQQRRRFNMVSHQHSTLHVALRQYNIQRLLYQQDVQQLQLLGEMISLSSKTLEDRLEFDKHARRIMCVDSDGAGKWEVIQLLIQLCGNPDVRMPAITCLLNVTAIESQEHDLEIVMHVRNYGFLQLVHDWTINASTVSDEHLGMAYDVLSNCLTACPAFCKDVMQCPLLCFYADPAVYKPEEAAMSPVLRLLNKSPAMPSLQFFIHIMMESMLHSQYVIPYHFVCGVWRSLIQTLLLVHRPLQANARNMDSMPIEQRIAVHAATGTCILCVFLLILATLNNANTHYSCCYWLD
jgi:hypothetical protein